MKRTVLIVLLAALLASSFPMTGHAMDMYDESRVVQVFDDGSYIEETLCVVRTRASGTVSGNRERTYYGSDGSSDWMVVLSGSFSYNGTTASCTSASCSVSIYDTAWYTVSKSAWKSGNTAYASASIGEKVLGVTVREVPVSLSLSCDANGNLS